MTWTLHLLKSILIALNLYLTDHTRPQTSTGVAVVRELTKRKEKKRTQLKSYPLKRKKFVREKLLRHTKNTKPRDNRFSNQKSLRRMYRNS